MSMEDIKALTECAECTWDYIDRLRMALAAACKERDELKKELHEAKSELAKYREAEQAGLLVVLPCKVGDTVYQIDAERVYESEVKWIIFDCDDIAFDERAIGGSIFLTREEAEEALKGGEG